MQGKEVKPGVRVRLLAFDDDDQTEIGIGSTGTVRRVVDDAAEATVIVHVEWDEGISLSLFPEYGDRFEVIEEADNGE